MPDAPSLIGQAISLLFQLSLPGFAAIEFRKIADRRCLFGASAFFSLTQLGIARP